MPESVERHLMGPDRHMTPLQRERQRRGWTLEYVAEELRRLGWKSAEPNAVSRHERGVISRPRAPVPDLYAKLYGKPVAVLWPDHDVVAWLDTSYDLGEELPELAVRHVGDADVDRIRVDTDTFGLMDQRHGGGHVRWMVVEYLRREVAPLLHGTYSDRVGRELFATAAMLTRRAGMMAYDAGSHGPARSHLHRALQLARHAGHRTLSAHVLTSMSHHALDLGHTEEAMQLLHAARQDAQDAPALLAKAAVMEARLHARLGDPAACEQALSLASRAFDRSDPAHDPEWIANANEAYLAGQFGNCYLDLGQPDRADPYLRSALAGYRPEYVRRRAMATALLARCDLERGELEQACSAGAEAIDLAVRLKSRRALAGISDLQQRLEPHHRERPVREFTEHAATLL
jgi:transcriptional regulator with XRE-family HTH domain